MPASEPVDHGLNAHRAAVAHLQACMEALDAETNGDTDVQWPKLLSAPFCGCDDCQVREVLTAAWPHVLAAARDELGFTGGSQTGRIRT